MLRRCCLVAGLLAISLSSPSWGMDRIKLLQGTPNVVNGSVTEMSPTVVKIEQGQVPKSFAVNLIEYIEFDEDPKDLKNARTAMKAGKLSDALALVNKVDPAEVKRTEIKQDVDFYKAVLMARLAMAGSGDMKDAGRLLFAFEQKNASNYHYFAACEALGDLLVADRKYDKAEPYYAKLASALARLQDQGHRPDRPDPRSPKTIRQGHQEVRRSRRHGRRQQGSRRPEIDRATGQSHVTGRRRQDRRRGQDRPGRNRQGRCGERRPASPGLQRAGELLQDGGQAQGCHHRLPARRRALLRVRPSSMPKRWPT